MIDPEIAMQLYDPAIKKRRGGHIPYRHKFATDEEMGRIDLTEQKKAWKSFLKKKKAGVYDPASKTQHKGSWLDFVKQHKDMRTAKGLLDLKAISKLWKEEKAKGYDPGKHTQWGQVQKHRRRARYTSTVDDYSPVRKHWRRLFDLLDTKTRPPVKWFYAMLKGIKHGSDVANPAAIVSSIWQRLSPSKRAEIKAKEARGGTFKYDLPLPEDMQTRGTGTLRIVKPFKLAEVQVNLSVKDYLHALKSGLFSRMKRGDGTTALVKRCKSDKGNCNIFLDQ